MELINYLNKVKYNKRDDILNNLIHGILSSEQTFIETPDDIVSIKASINYILYNSFCMIKQNKFEIKTDEIDLEYLKISIKNFKSTNIDMDSSVYFYAIRTSLKNLIFEKHNNFFLKTHIIEIIMVVFLLIDFLDYSIDEILEI